MTPRTALVLTLLPIALAAGCTKATPPQASSDTVTSASSGSASDSATDSSSPTTSSVAPATSATSTKASAPTSAAPSAADPGPAGCATSALKIMVLRGSGAAGHQFASVQFTNISAAECSLVGFPGAVLLKSGAELGSPAARSALPVTRVILKPGSRASAKLQNDSTCNADVSDSVQIIVPNRTEKSVLPLQMRGCPLTIDPVALG